MNSKILTYISILLLMLTSCASKKTIVSKESVKKDSIFFAVHDSMKTQEVKEVTAEVRDSIIRDNIKNESTNTITWNNTIRTSYDERGNLVTESINSGSKTESVKSMEERISIIRDSISMYRDMYESELKRNSVLSASSSEVERTDKSAEVKSGIPLKWLFYMLVAGMFAGANIEYWGYPRTNKS